MKVLHVVRPFLRISENWIYPQITGVPGVEPGILCDEQCNEDQFPAPGANFILDPPPWKSRFGIPRLVNSIAFRLGNRGLVARGVIEQWNPEIIHAHFGMSGCDTLDLAERFGLPLVTSFYGIDAWKVSPARRARLTRLFELGAAFVVEGPAMAERMIEIGCPADRLHVCRIGVDLRHLDYTPVVPGDELRVVMMARFVPKKGFEDGLIACARANDRGVSLRITIIGDATPGDADGRAIGEKLRELASRPPLAGRVTFAGFLKPENAQALLYEHDIFLVPSIHAPDGDAEGGAPVALTEAMAMGLLCLGTRHCDIPELIQDGRTGFLVDSGDPEALATTLERIALSPDRHLALRYAARKRVEELFSRREQVEGLQAIYARVRSRPARVVPARPLESLQFQRP